MLTKELPIEYSTKIVYFFLFMIIVVHIYINTLQIKITKNTKDKIAVIKPPTQTGSGFFPSFVSFVFEKYTYDATPNITAANKIKALIGPSLLIFINKKII